MKTRRFRKSAGFVVVSELTVACHLLLFLPPKAQAAVAVPVEREEESGESALSLLKVESAEPASQEPVVVNTTPPDVEPPAQYPTFSPIPTDEELFRARVFGEPLIPEAGETNDAENQALAQAITTYLYGGDSEALEPLEGVVTSFPQSRFRVAVQANVGSWYAKKGYFTRGQRNLLEAWKLGKNSKTEGVRRLAEFAAGELMLLHAQFGQVDPLEALVTEFAGRELSGGITEKLYVGHATVWGLRNDHGNAIPSGRVALERLRLDKHEKEEKRKKDQDPSYKKKPFQRNAALDSFPADHDGASLAEIQDLSDLTDLKLQMVKRENPGAEIPIPSLVHLRQGHFAALVEKRGERFRFDDPLLGGEVWMSREAFEEEISGFFLIEQGPIPRGFRAANRTETEPIRGKCVYATADPDGTRPCDIGGGGCGDSCGSGMAGYRFHLLRASLSVSDNPVGYSPPRGPEVRFRVTYNQREANQPTTFTYSNLGKRWNHNWMSYVEDDPTAVGNPVNLYVRGGGREPYSGFASGISAPQQDIRAVTTIVSTTPIKYERELPDGSKEIFAQSDGAATAPRRVFLTEVKDPQGNKLTLTYDGQLRLVSVTDAISQVTTLSYEIASDPLKITKVTDPFGRSAKFQYDELGQLVKITDVIGIASEFEYGVNQEYLSSTMDFIRALTTPYGTTTFRSGVGPYAGVSNNRWVEAIDPLGGTERVEHILNGTNPLSATDAANTVPVGFTGNANLNTHLSIYYGKLVMSRQTADPPTPTDGEITRFRSSSQFKVSGFQIQSTKLPLENRVWYEHEGETTQNGVGPKGRPAKIGRVIGDGSSQIQRAEFNDRGNLQRFTDPLGREVLFEYEGNGVDLKKVSQKNGATYDVLGSAAYNTSHRPLTLTDASGQTTTLTFNSSGQMLTYQNPKNELTTFGYDTYGYLQTVTGPVANATVGLTWDAFGRVRTVTADSRTLTVDYDTFDRPTKITYPDSTYEQVTYQRLDPSSFRDRLGQMSQFFYDAAGRLAASVDPSGRTLTQKWCQCGALEGVLDGAGNATSWELDLQGRVTKETRADGNFTTYTYDTAAGRLIEARDPKNQIAKYEYFLDDTLKKARVTNTSDQDLVPSVTYSYDGAYQRVTSVQDATGTTSYGYLPIGASAPLGAGQLASVDGPLANDTLTYSYDALGRVTSSSLGGVAASHTFDALGRVNSNTNALGTFLYDYVGVTDRPSEVQYPNGQKTSLTYFGASGDDRLKEIIHRKPDGSLLSKHVYTYDANGRVSTWEVEASPSAAEVWTYGYDRAEQLTSAVKKSTGTPPVVLKRYAYGYDAASNRTTEQGDDVPVAAVHNALNQLTNLNPGGALKFAGTLSEGGTVTVGGKPATVSSTNSFEGSTESTSGTNTVVVKATDWSNNTRTNTYDVSVSGSSKTLTYDLNGNLTGDGTRTYEWDALDQLTAVVEGTKRSEFTYDGAGRRVRIVEKENSVTVSDKKFVWCGLSICEERDAGTGAVKKRFFAQGVEDNGTDLFYQRDHLGSVREVTDSTAALRARYDFDPWGRRSKVSGNVDADMGFTGHFQHAVSSLALAPFRAYDANIGRWLSADPLGLSGGANLYGYAANTPTNAVDPYGDIPAFIAAAGVAGVIGGAIGAGLAWSNGATGAQIAQAFLQGFVSAALGTLAGFGVGALLAPAVGGVGIGVGAISATVGNAVSQLVAIAGGWQCNFSFYSLALSPLLGLGGGAAGWAIGRSGLIGRLSQAAGAVRHFTSVQGLRGVMSSNAIPVSRGGGVWVVTPPFGPVASAQAQTGAAASGAFVQFNAPASGVVPTPWVGPINTGLIPTTTPLSLTGLQPIFVSFVWW